VILTLKREQLRGLEVYGEGEYFRLNDGDRGSSNWSCHYDLPYIVRYPVVRRTEKGAWIRVHGAERFVLDGAGKRFAYTSLEAAFASYLARKERAVLLSQCALDQQEEMLKYAKQLFQSSPTTYAVEAASTDE
jgi:hypothetical protein